MAAGPGDRAAMPTASNASTSPLMNVRIRGVVIDPPLSEGKHPRSIVACTWLTWKRSHVSKEFARATYQGRPNAFCAKR